MTDDLVERLRTLATKMFQSGNWGNDLDTTKDAADRIKQLTAELADAEALIEAQAKDHASNNIRFAEAEHRAKTAEAERDRLREALEHIISDCEADYPPSHGAIKYAAKLALKGETP